MTTIMYSHWRFKYESHVRLQMCNAQDFQTTSSLSLKMALPQDGLASRWLCDGRKQIGLVEIDNELPRWIFLSLLLTFSCTAPGSKVLGQRVQMSPIPPPLLLHLRLRMSETLTCDLQMRNVRMRVRRAKKSPQRSEWNEKSSLYTWQCGTNIVLIRWGKCTLPTNKENIPVVKSRLIEMLLSNSSRSDEKWS